MDSLAGVQLGKSVAQVFIDRAQNDGSQYEATRIRRVKTQGPLVFSRGSDEKSRGALRIYQRSSSIIGCQHVNDRVLDFTPSPLRATGLTPVGPLALTIRSYLLTTEKLICPKVG